jgi:hypothetical protein
VFNTKSLTSKLSSKEQDAKTIILDLLSAIKKESYLFGAIAHGSNDMTLTACTSDQNTISLRYTLKRLNDFSSTFECLPEYSRVTIDERQSKRVKVKIHITDLIKLLTDIYYILTNKVKLSQEEQLDDLILSQLFDGARVLCQLVSSIRVYIAEIHDCVYKFRKFLRVPNEGESSTLGEDQNSNVVEAKLKCPQFFFNCFIFLFEQFFIRINEHKQRLESLLKTIESYPVKTNEEVEIRKFIQDCDKLQKIAFKLLQCPKDDVLCLDAITDDFLKLYESLPSNLFTESCLNQLNLELQYALKFDAEVIYFFPYIFSLEISHKIYSSYLISFTHLLFLKKMQDY